MRLLCICMFLLVVAGCRMASVPDGGEKQEISVAAVRYMASVGNAGRGSLRRWWRCFRGPPFRRHSFGALVIIRSARDRLRRSAASRAEIPC